MLSIEVDDYFIGCSPFNAEFYNGDDVAFNLDVRNVSNVRECRTSCWGDGAPYAAVWGKFHGVFIGCPHGAKFCSPYP